MYFIAEFTHKDRYGTNDRVLMIEANSVSEAEVKLHKHFDAALYRTQESGDFTNVGGDDNESEIVDFEITECIR